VPASKKVGKLFPKARSPNYDPRAKSGPQRKFVNDEKLIHLGLRKTWFGRMQLIPKKSHIS